MVSQTRDRYVPRSTWTALSDRTLAALTTAVILAVTASLLTASLGPSDGIVLVALATVGVTALGLALVRLFVFLETNALSVLEANRT